MKIAVDLNKNNIITGYLYLASQDYSKVPDATIIDVDKEEDIIEYKTKYENGELSYLDDYAPEYYAQQNLDEQRRQLEDQLAELYAWFDEYDNQIKQYERDVRLGAIGTYHIGEQEYTIQQLDELATEKASQISAIRNQIA